MVFPSEPVPIPQRKEAFAKAKAMVINMEFLGGILMAFANSVPGVSGGTIAFLLGIFDDIINSLNAFLTKKAENRKQSFLFLVKLILGWAVGFVIALLVLGNILNDYIYEVSSLFIGFIVFSVPLIIYEEKATLALKTDRLKNGLKALFILPGFGAVLGITLLSTYFTAGSTSSGVQALLALPAGALAICAMIMPGISGSSIMLIFGLYEPIIFAARNILSFDFSGILLLGAFAAGALAGALCFVKGLKILLNRYRAQTVYVVLGMMIASVYSVWIGPTTLDQPREAMSFSSFSILFFLAGGLFIGLLEVVKYLLNRKAKKQTAPSDANTEEN